MRRDALETNFGFNTFTKRAVEDPVHLCAKGPSGKSWTKCGRACRDRTI